MARLVGRSVVDVCGEMTWPAVTFSVIELGYKCRNAPESLTKSDHLVLASIVDAYLQMIHDPAKKRNAVCREIAKASLEVT
jgi:hypothetical protein